MAWNWLLSSGGIVDRLLEPGGPADRVLADGGVVDRVLSTDGILDRVLARPDDHQARFDLAQALHAAGKVEGAVEELLELLRRDREWNEGAAKQQLFTIFDALKPNDPIALRGRRKLSSILFS